MARGSLTAPLACALLKQETIVRARNVVRIRVHASGVEKFARKWVFELVSIANVSKKIEKMKRVDVLCRGLRP